MTFAFPQWADSMKRLGFFPSRSDPDVWMKDKGDHYEYVVVYVDDLLYAYTLRTCTATCSDRTSD